MGRDIFPIGDKNSQTRTQTKSHETFCQWLGGDRIISSYFLPSVDYGDSANVCSVWNHTIRFCDIKEGVSSIEAEEEDDQEKWCES